MRFGLKTLGLLLPLALLAYLGVGAWLLLTGLQAGAQVQTEAAGLRSALEKSLPDFGRIAAIREPAGRGADRLWAAQVWLTPVLGPLRLAGPPLQGWPALLDLTQAALRAAAATSDALVGLQSLQGAGAANANLLEAAPKALASAGPVWRGARQDLATAIAARRAIEPTVWPATLPTVRKALGEFDQVAPDWERFLTTGAAISSVAGSITGLNGRRIYAILGQNDHELRPTGGFIGSAGLLEVDGGRIVRFEYTSSTEFDNRNRARLEPPGPLVEYLGVGNWYVRDANWSPDFPTTAQQVAQFMQLDRQVTVDGVFAVDTVGLAYLLEAGGAIPVAEFQGLVNGRTMYEQSRQRIYVDTSGSGPRDGQARKSYFLGGLFRSVLQSVLDLRGPKVLPVAQALGRALTEKHALVWLRQPAEQQLIADLGWDGRLGPTRANDALALVDATVAYVEIADYIDRTIDYTARINPDGSVHEATIELTYVNRAKELLPANYRDRIGDVLSSQHWDAQARRLVDEVGYWGDYLRLYLPAGSRLLEWSQLDSDLEYLPELGRGVVAGYLGLHLGEQRTFQLKYVPPPVNREGRFDLDYRAQPGARPPLLRLHLVPMPGTRFAEPSGGWKVKPDGSVQFEGKPAVDGHFAVRTQP